VMIGAGMVAAAIVGWAALFEGNWGRDAFFLPMLVVFCSALFLTSGAASYAILRRLGMWFWVICAAFLVLFAIITLIKMRGATGGFPGFAEFLFFLFVLVPILVGWLVGAGYQLFRGRKRRATREAKDVET
jgi:uncharacterized membrane protein YhaH (DUF805 family)